jgi:OOP family OmpA-OmpF porin
VLDQVASALLATGAVMRVEVQGHTDATGNPAYNQQLSEARARSVLQALVARGVPVELLSARGYGPQRPIADNATPDGRSKNRRVQFEVQERGVE